MGVLGGAGAVVGRRGWASAVLALWGCGGPWGGPAVWAGIVAGRRVLGAAVDRGRVRLLCMVPGLGCVLRSACLGCWRRCMASSLAVIEAAGGPAVGGVLFPFGSLPQVHSRVAGIPGQVFAALTRRGLVPLPQKPIKRAFPVSKNLKKQKRCLAIGKNYSKNERVHIDKLDV